MFPRNFSFYTMKVALIHPFYILFTVLKFTFCLFLAKNCGKIFSNMVFLLATMCNYCAMMPVSHSDFMVPTDISYVLCSQGRNTLDN